MLDEGEVRLLTRSIRLADKQADDAMVPRVEVVAIAADASVADLADLAARTGHSRFPVIGRHLDDVAGVVHVKSLFAVPVQDRPVHACVAVDEAGAGGAGVPRPRRHAGRSAHRRGGSWRWWSTSTGGRRGSSPLRTCWRRLSARSTTSTTRPRPSAPGPSRGARRCCRRRCTSTRCSEATGFAMPEGAYETLAGLVLDRLGHIPVPGEIATVEGWRLEVVAVNGLRIAAVRVVAPSEAGQSPLRRARPVTRFGRVGGLAVSSGSVVALVVAAVMLGANAFFVAAEFALVAARARSPRDGRGRRRPAQRAGAGRGARPADPARWGLNSESPWPRWCWAIWPSRPSPT